MPTLTFELMSTTHEDHKPTQEGNSLVFCAAEGPTFIKKGGSKTIRTGAKLRIPAGHLAMVGHRSKHGDHMNIADVAVYAPGDNEGLTGEISVRVTAPNHSDLVVRFGEGFAAAYLVKVESLAVEGPSPKKEEPKTKKVKTAE